MKTLLSSPKVNAVCLSVFTAFYALIFIIMPRNAEIFDMLYSNRVDCNVAPFWKNFSNFLAAGYEEYIAYALIAVTVLVVVLLLLRRHPYDEYHTSLLYGCLSVAVILTLIAIAVFYLMILSDSSGIIEKFTMFIAIHWTVVVLSDLSFVLLCGWR
ncbi:MAG: hypothetical protein CVU91_05055 [Firmicutes bacterium HGW-Firmicutes-16]|nr:MAG: hypothetical protein CVU91_05055 [Firmicutes bacterium HGW-Firmicutes-16]